MVNARVLKTALTVQVREGWVEGKGHHVLLFPEDCCETEYALVAFAIFFGGILCITLIPAVSITISIAVVSLLT